MKRKALIIPATIRSHVLPSFFIADMLSENYEVTYAVANKILEDLVQKNGYKTQLISKYKIGVGYEKVYLEDKGKNVNFFSILKSIYTNDLYWYRKKEIEKLLAIVNPEVVIIDVYNSTDFILIHACNKNIKVLFFNPMPSTYKVEGYPIVSENVWLKDTKNLSENKKLPLFFRSPAKAILQLISGLQLQKLLRLAQISKENGIVKNNFIKAFENIPELLLLPLEFELSASIKKNHQHYLGLCQRENRIDTELDEGFQAQWQSILEQKQQGKRIIYCSFGTFFESADLRLVNFMHLTLETIVNIPNIFLVCSANKYVLQTLLSQNKEFKNAAFFYKVPQLQILSIADLFITHGGLGSIKESISYKVPMLVYPLDLHYDQSGNALKVEYHGIGLRGNFTYEQKNYMQAKIKKLLNDPLYKQNITKLNDTISITYTLAYYKELQNLLLV